LAISTLISLPSKVCLLNSLTDFSANCNTVAVNPATVASGAHGFMRSVRRVRVWGAALEQQHPQVAGEEAGVEGAVVEGTEIPHGGVELEQIEATRVPPHVHY